MKNVAEALTESGVIFNKAYPSAMAVAQSEGGKKAYGNRLKTKEESGKSRAAAIEEARLRRADASNGSSN